MEYILNDCIPIQKDKLNYGDILFPTRNTLELVAKISIWRNELPMAYFNSNIMRFEFNSVVISSNSFMNYLFNTKQFIAKLKGIATGTKSVAAIYNKVLMKIEIHIPSKSEQIIIAAILSDIDEEIIFLENKLEKYRQIKQGRMQTYQLAK